MLSAGSVEITDIAKGMSVKTIITKRESGRGKRRVVCQTVGPSMTEQSHKEKVNINTIMARATKTGMMKRRIEDPTYGDFTGALDYHSAVEKVMKAEADFMELPADVRKRFQNNPGGLIDFLADEGNREEAISLGLIDGPPEEVVPVGTNVADGGPVEDGGNSVVT